MRANIITKETMSQVYEKESWLYWNVRKSKIQKDSLAGCLNGKGYYMVRINGKLYMNHRILYQIYNNIILTENDIIDHHDRNPLNNSKENLLLSDNSENGCNRKTPKTNKSTGLKNIFIKTSGKYEYYYIKITKKGKIVFSKYFSITTPTEKLIEIRDEQLKIHHGEFMSKG